jgi:hypothetical protein
MKLTLLVATAVVLASCTGLPTIQTGADPADPYAPAPHSRYAPVTAGTVDYRIVEPKPWVQQNERLAPKSGSKP